MNPLADSFTPFAKEIDEIEETHHEDGQSFFNAFIKLFETINKLSVPIDYVKIKGKSKAQMIIFGEIGNGKSTTGNALCKELLKRKGKSFKKTMAFVACKSTKAVTKKLTMKYYTGLNILDTPGFNDPDK